MNKRELNIEFNFSPSDIVYCRIYSILTNFKEKNLSTLEKYDINVLDLPDFIALEIFQCVYIESLVTGERLSYYICKYTDTLNRAIYLSISEELLISESNIDTAVQIFNHDNKELNFYLDKFCFNKLRNHIPFNGYNITISLQEYFDFNINDAVIVGSREIQTWDVPRTLSLKVAEVTVVYRGIGLPITKELKSLYKDNGEDITVSKLKFE